MSLVLIHSARQLITLRGGAGPRRGPAMGLLHVIEDGALLIENGIIVEVGPTRRVENLAIARKARDISAAGRVVMPGFVDSHTHLISGPSRLPEADVVPVRAPPQDARLALANVPFVRESTSRRLAADATEVLSRSLAHGTTTIEAKSGYGLSTASEAKILRVLASLGGAPITVLPTCGAALLLPPEFENRPVEYIDWVRHELLPPLSKRGLIRFVDGGCDPGAFTSSQLRPLYDTVRELGLPMKLHSAQFGNVDMAALVAAYPFISLDHLDHVDRETIHRIAGTGAIATLAPASTFFLRTEPYAPARTMIEHGIPIALATNYSRVTSPTSNLQMCLFLACHEYGMTPAEAITAATINGAYALNLGGRIGSLEAGKQADLLILRAGDYRELVYEFGINLVDVTMKNGAVVFDRSGVKWPAAS